MDLYLSQFALSLKTSEYLALSLTCASMYSSQIQDTNIFKVNNVSLKHKYRAHAVWCLSSRSRIEQCYKDFNSWAVVVAQLVERLLLIPVIGKNLYILNICLLSTVY